MAEIIDAQALERALMEALPTPAYVRSGSKVKWVWGPRKLLHEGMADGWSTHSARKLLPSLAGALQAIPPWEVDQLGRWQHGGSWDYVQSQADATRRVQDLVAQSLMNLSSWYSESELMAGLGSFMEERGIGEKEKEHVLNGLRFDMKGHPFAADLVASGSSLANNQVPGEHRRPGEVRAQGQHGAEGGCR